MNWKNKNHPEDDRIILKCRSSNGGDGYQMRYLRIGNAWNYE